LAAESASCNPVVNLPLLMFGILLSEYISDKRFMRIFAAFAAVVLAATAFGRDGMWGGGEKMFSGAALFVLIAAAYGEVRTGSAWKRVVGFLAKYSFMAFLFQHQIIIQFLEMHEDMLPSIATHSSALWSYGLGMVMLSYLAAYLAYPFGERLDSWLRSRLLPPSPLPPRGGIDGGAVR
jgi:hypothetical protein